MRKKHIIFVAIILSIVIAIPFLSNSQIFKTTLQITIRNELGNTEAGARVTLYKTEEDYNASQNPVFEAQTTDAKGKATFEGVEPIIYFVQAEKGERDNSGAGEKTPKLDANKINKVTIIISE
jgi:hypothetical protein